MHNADEPLDRDLVDALDTLDYPVQRTTADAIIRRARARAAQRRWRFAAAAVVMLAASAAAALPGSPVRRWVVAALRGAASSDAPPATSREQVPSVVPATPPDTRGVVTFIGDSAEVVFSDWQDTGEVVIRFIPEPELRVRGTGFPVSFLVRPAGILVNNTGSSASYQLDIASAASDLRILANGRAIFERRNGRVVRGPLPRSDGAYVVSLRHVKTP